MGINCCVVDLDNCPEAVVVGVPFDVVFQVVVTDICENCLARCLVVVPGQGPGAATCVLSSPGLTPNPDGTLPIPPSDGLIPVTATVTVNACPPGAASIVVDLAVNCDNCSDSAVCLIGDCSEDD